MSPDSRPFLGQVVDLGLLLCTGFDSEHVVLFLCPNFTQRQINDRKIRWIPEKLGCLPCKVLLSLRPPTVYSKLKLKLDNAETVFCSHSSSSALPLTKHGRGFSESTKFSGFAGLTKQPKT